MQIGYGFRIPKREYNNLLKRQTVESDEYEIGDYTGDRGDLGPALDM